MTETALTNVNPDEIIRALEGSLYPGAKPESIRLVVEYCRVNRLDPFTRPVHIVPMSVKVQGTRDTYVWRDTIMPSIELQRIKAHRTGEYAGCSEVEFGPTICSSFRDANGEIAFSLNHPEWAKITVTRKHADGTLATFTARAEWLESYATVGKNSEIPNAMWRKRPKGQLEKCVEAAALRRGFPEASGYIREELEGKILGEETLEEPVHALEPPVETERKTGGNRTKKLLASVMPAPTPEPAPPEAELDAALHASLRNCASKEALEQFRPTVAALKGPRRAQAVAVWTEVMNQIQAGAEAAAAPVPTPTVAEPESDEVALDGERA